MSALIFCQGLKSTWQPWHIQVSLGSLPWAGSRKCLADTLSLLSHLQTEPDGVVGSRVKHSRRDFGDDWRKRNLLSVERRRAWRDLLRSGTCLAALCAVQLSVDSGSLLCQPTAAHLCCVFPQSASPVRWLRNIWCAEKRSVDGLS